VSLRRRHLAAHIAGVAAEVDLVDGLGPAGEEALGVVDPVLVEQLQG